MKRGQANAGLMQRFLLESVWKCSCCVHSKYTWPTVDRPNISLSAIDK